MANKGIWKRLDEFEGDKMVLMIALLLILISLLAIFSSTSLLAIEKHTSRMKIMGQQVFIAAGGMVAMLACYSIKKVRLLRILAQCGFFLSLLMLLFLMAHMNLGFIRAASFNHAWRIISIFGFQLHVFEFVKILMVLYVAWACQAYEKNEFTLLPRLAERWNQPWMDRPFSRQVFYIWGPIFVTVALELVGSGSSALFLLLICTATALIGGISVRRLILPGLLAVSILGLGAVGINRFTDGKVLPRLETWTNRLMSHDREQETVHAKKAWLAAKGIEERTRMREAYQKVLDENRQPLSAKIAVKEGGFIGKGPGKSSQRYVVSVMFGDYMYSFLVEEYGLLGGILVILLYLSLLARGSIIARNCTTTFAKTAVAGLVVMITGQAFLHICINVDLGPLTGQTLPMISHGNSSFLAFSMAFGILLSISRMAKKGIRREASRLDPLMERDEVSERMEELDRMEEMADIQEEEALEEQEENFE